MGQAALGSIIPQGGLEGVVSDSVSRGPIPEARVEIFASTPDRQIVIIAPVAETLTDQNGFYKFENLPALYYLARYSRDGYENVMEKIQIQSNQITNLNILLAPLGAPTPSPTPQPKAYLHGRVVEYVGILTVVPKPLPNTHIMVFISLYTPGIQTGIEPMPSLFCEAYTNEEGLYEIPEIPYGSYNIVAQAEGYYPEKALMEVNIPDVERNFELRRKALPTPTSTPLPPPLGEVSGIVAGLNEDGVTTHPLAGAVIEVFNSFQDCWGKSKCISPPVLRAVADENGFYDIPNIPGGLWQICALAEGYLTEIQEADIIPDEKTEVNFTLEPGSAPRDGEISGMVRGDPPDGVCTLIPLRLAGAKIEVFDAALYNTDTGASYPGEGIPIAVVYSNEEGMYRVENLEKNRFYILKASFEHYYPQYKTAVIFNDPVAVHFFLKYKSEPPPSPTGSVIKGRVFEKCFQTNDLKPIVGALVKIEKLISPLDISTSPPLLVYTDPEGFYMAENLEPGYYVMEARANGYYPGFRHALLGPDEIKIVHFALAPVPPEPTQTPLPDNGSLSGVVFALGPQIGDEPTTPIAGALVSLYPMLKPSQWMDPCVAASAVTDDAGQYQIPDIPPGSYVAVAEAAGFRRCMKNAIIPPGAGVILNFGLRPDVEPTPTPVPGMGNISGQVMSIASDDLLEPLPGASVLLFSIPSFKSEIIPAPIRQTLTNEEGKFEIPDVAAGDYVIMAEAEGYLPDTTPVQVKTGEIQEVTLKIKPFIAPTPTPSPFTGTLEGHLAFESAGDLIPIPSGQVFAIRLGNNTPDLMGNFFVNHTATNEYGYYRFISLVEGRYLVVATAEGFYPSQGETDVLPQQIATMDFVLEALDSPTTGTGILFGRVMTVDAPTTPGSPPNFIPLKDADILALQVHPSLLEEETLIPAGKAITDNKGEYIVENLPGGMYAVIARKYGYSWSIKNARVRPANATRINFLLIPLEAAPPDPGKTIVFENNFDETEENWRPGGAPDTFLMPRNIHEQGRLQLSCSDNLNTFGYWHSPLDAVPLNENVIYKAIYAISSDITDLTKVPCIRIRFNSQSEQIADMMVINSRGDAAVCPGPAGRIYALYFSLPSQEIHLPENENDIYVSFDIVNLDKNDAKNAVISLDWIKIEALPTLSLPQGTQIASLDFTQGSHGWENLFAQDVFSPPIPLSGPESGGLAFKSVNNTKTYGVWASPVNLITLQGDFIYAIRWSLYSDQLETSSVPGIRLRASDEQNRLITQKCIFSNAEGDNSPTAAGGEYTMYYVAPQELDGAGLTLAFDLVNFDKTDAPTGTIGARSVTVWAIPADQMP